MESQNCKFRTAFRNKLGKKLFDFKRQSYKSLKFSDSALI